MFTPAEADQELKTGARLCPGPWEQHSMSVAQNARLIAHKAGCMDCDKAYVMGLMHDIGRRAGIKGILHIFDGYDYMDESGTGGNRPDLPDSFLSVKGCKYFYRKI